MTDLRKAAEMALEALEIESKGYADKVVRNKGVITALRQALAQPEQDELFKQGWRQCAIGQRTTQYCGMAEQARLEEREACAKVCEDEICACCWDDDAQAAAEHLAAAIRARGEK